MEAIPEKTVDGLLAFIVQSDVFFEWAERTSSGSLSPRTKWKALTEFEFPLPPLERQAKTMDVLKVSKVILERLNTLEHFHSLSIKAFYKDYLASKLEISEVSNRPLSINSAVPIMPLRKLWQNPKWIIC